ncbi:cytochrome b N-terminal domain-containing protein [Aeoliella mucimassa]|uniref:Menaquinol-cytochrome c reductase cytochrome b subunit n=1 Tax=Aeoliella mucimassa TaxID=2527972 RepID=A0A518AIN6_9BACT|nr:cytochrome b N-terminal domain-containing protein [Aeoliella mucimassa]QDU54577.1 Menaquinol-cytochrome c reductase cytochrome b subunit [Aeoliella mucimassa]
MKSLIDWLDNRTGIKQAIASVFYQRIPGGARWRYVWGTTLLFAVVVQFITGIVLWMHYSPSTQTAWESVYYIQHEMTGGALLRGIHLYTSSAVMLLMSLHLLQVVVHGAYRRPREVTYWLGLGAMVMLLGLGQTGYLLTWDQRGFGAAKVATNIAGASPSIGDDVKAIALGGDDLGHHTLTRFAALHMGVLPAGLVFFLVLHAAVGRRQGLTPPEKETDKPDGVYWPDQALRDAVVSLAVIATVVWIAMRFPAELGPPSDGSVEFNTARPEWYFRFLFQLLKYFPGASGMFIASQLIPGIIMLVLLLMPFIGNWKLGRWFNTLFVLSVFAGIGVLTALSFNEDYNGKTEKSKHYLADLRLAHAEAERSIELASMGIPVDGARGQTRRDPLIAGRRLFKAHCASCHSHHDVSLENPHEEGDPLTTVVCDEPTAANLYKFGSREWMEGMLDHEKLVGPEFFGNTIFAEGDMVYWVQGTITDELADLPDDEKQAFKMQVRAAAWAISGLAELPYQKEKDEEQSEQLEQGMDIVLNELSCIDCHTLGDEEAGAGPDLTDYASEEWLTEFIRNPRTERFYYSEDNYDEADRLMPGYATHADDPDLNTLSDEEISLIVRWIRRDWPVAENEAAEESAEADEPAAEPAPDVPAEEESEDTAETSNEES